MALGIETATGVADTGVVGVPVGTSYPVTVNDPALTARTHASLSRAAGADRVEFKVAQTGAEDFAYFSEKVPGFYFFLGGRPASVPKAEAADHDTADFHIDDSGLGLGVRAMVQLTMDYLTAAVIEALVFRASSGDLPASQPHADAGWWPGKAS